MSEANNENEAAGTAQLPLTLGAAAVARIMHLADAIPEQSLQRVNADLNALSVTALGAWPRIKAARADVLRKNPNHDTTYFDCFEDIALSLSQVEAQVDATEEENRVLTGQAEAIKVQINDLKDLLVGQGNYGGINMAPLRKVGSEFGYRALIRDAGTLTQMFVQNWQLLNGRVPFAADRLQAFDREVAEFRAALGRKEQDPEGPRAELMLRRRVFTLFRLAVASIREAIIYTYGESKVGDYVPAFANLAKASSKGANATESQLDAPSEANATAVHGTGVNTTAASSAVTGAKRPSGFVVNNPDNLPITSPFIEDDEDDAGQRSA